MRGRRTGRPTKYSPTRAGKVLALVEVGVSQAVAATAAGVHPSTLYAWRQQFPEFRESLNVAQGRAGVRCAQTIYKAAVIDRDWRAAAFWLVTRCPEDWHRRAYVNADVSVTTPKATITREECNRRLAELFAFPAQTETAV